MIPDRAVGKLDALDRIAFLRLPLDVEPVIGTGHCKGQHAGAAQNGQILGRDSVAEHHRIGIIRHRIQVNDEIVPRTVGEVINIVARTADQNVVAGAFVETVHQIGSERCIVAIGSVQIESAADQLRLR